MTESVSQPHTLTTLLLEIAAFYDRQLAVPEVQQAPNVEYIRTLRELMAFLAEDEAFVQNHVLIITTAQAHMLTGIPAVDLGYPPPSSEQHEAADLLIRHVGRILEPHAAEHSAAVREIVAELRDGHAPRGKHEFATFLALVQKSNLRRRKGSRLQKPAA